MLAIPETQRLASSVMDVEDIKISPLCENATGAKANMPLHSLVPGDNDVLFEGGKLSFRHAGNRRLRSIALARFEMFANASTKLERYEIIKKIIRFVTQRSVNGRFLRRKSSSDSWTLVSQRGAQEIIVRILRQAAQARKAQRATPPKTITARKPSQQPNHHAALDQMVHSNQQVATIMNNVTAQVSNDSFSDEQLLRMFQANNTRILTTLKQDQTVQKLASMVSMLKEADTTVSNAQH